MGWRLLLLDSLSALIQLPYPSTTSLNSTGLLMSIFRARIGHFFLQALSPSLCCELVLTYDGVHQSVPAYGKASAHHSPRSYLSSLIMFQARPQVSLHKPGTCREKREDCTSYLLFMHRRLGWA